MQETRLLDLAGDLYDAATDLTKWPTFLERLGRAFDATDTHILHFDPQETRFTFTFGHGPGMKLYEPLQDQFAEIFADDPRAIACLNYPGKPLSCRLSIGRDAWHASKTYQFMQDHGYVMEYTMSVTLPDEDGTLTGLAVMRDPGGRAFTQQDCDRLSALIPHLKRAIKLQKRLALLDFEQRMAFEALDHLPIGIIIMDDNAHIHTMNHQARKIVDQDDGLAVAKNVLMSEHPEDAAELRLLIQKAIASAKTGAIAPGSVVTINRNEKKKPYTALVSTLWGNHMRWGLGVLDKPMAVVFLTDPEQPQEAPHELLQRLFGLTRSEAGLTERLLSGATLEDAATGQGITINTARQYLKAVFLKTETNRQADLIRKIKDTPIWISHTHAGKTLPDAHA